MERRGVLKGLVFRLAAATLVCAALAGPPMAARADEAPERNIMLHYGLGVGSVGSITGGFAYLLTGGRLDVPREIIQPAVRGDYVVTPEHLTFNQPLLFVGRERALDKTSGDENYE